MTLRQRRFFLLLPAIIVGLFTTGCGSKQAMKPAPPATPLIECAASGDAALVKQHIAAGTNADLADPKTGSTALIAAATLGHTEAALALIDAGVDLEVKNNEGSTALITAAFLCREDIVKALLKNGADKNAKNLVGSTALDGVSGSFDEVKPIYEILQAVLGPAGLKLDYERIKKTRPKIAALLQESR